MKKFAFLLCILLALSMSGCATTEVSVETEPPAAESVCSDGSQEEETDKQDAEHAVSETAESSEPTASTESVAPSEGVESNETIIETKYYTLTLPEHWKETCFYSVIDETTVILRESGSYAEFGGGKLCSLRLSPVGDDTYKNLPSYELLTTLDTPDGSFYVIALFPTDVQFTPDTMQLYNTMFDELPDILATLQPKEGIERIST